MFENSIVVYKFVQDLHFFVTGGEDENELILATVLQGFFDAVGLLLRCIFFLHKYLVLHTCSLFHFNVFSPLRFIDVFMFNLI